MGLCFKFAEVSLSNESIYLRQRRWHRWCGDGWGTRQRVSVWHGCLTEGRGYVLYDEVVLYGKFFLKLYFMKRKDTVRSLSTGPLRKRIREE